MIKTVKPAGRKSASKKAKAKRKPDVKPHNLALLRRKPGVPAHVPSDASRNLVILAVAKGCTQEQIARLVGISENTLTKYYRAELDDGGEKLLITIAATLASIAQDKNHPKCAQVGMYIMDKTGGFGGKDKDDEKPDEKRDEKITFTINIGGTGTGKQQLPGDTAKLING